MGMHGIRTLHTVVQMPDRYKPKAPLRIPSPFIHTHRTVGLSALPRILDQLDTAA